MQETGMTLKQAFKVWWSYSWRASLLVIPLGILMTAWSLVGLVSVLKNVSASGGSLANLDVGQLAQAAGGGVALWVISLVLTAVVQVFAMRWALNSRWSDFRLQAVPTVPPAGPAPPLARPGSPP